MNDIQPAMDTSTVADGYEIDFGELLGVVIGARWLILLVMLFSALLGGFYAYTATPVYQADALLQVEEKASTLGDLGVTGMFDRRTPTNAEIEILRSRTVLGTVVDDLQLQIVAEPRYLPLIGSAMARRLPSSQRPAIQIDSLAVPRSLIGVPLALVATGPSSYEFSLRDGDVLLQGEVGRIATGNDVSIFVSRMQAEEGQAFEVRRRSRASSIRSLKSRLTVSEKGDYSGILLLRLEGSNAEQVRRQLDGIATAYVRQNVERKSEEAKQTLDFLTGQLPVVKQQMEAAETALNAYRLEKGSVDLPLETQAILETIVETEGQLSQLRQERDKTIQAFTPLHPTVVALDRQIESLNAEISALNAQVRDLPSTQQEVLRLVRDVEVYTALYTSLLNSAQELRVVKAGTIGNVRIIDNAMPQYTPVRPKKMMILVLSLILGVFVGVAIALARRAFNAGLEDPDLIEKHINLPVYATVPHSKRQDRITADRKSKERAPAILATSSPNDPAIESLRNLRTALHFGMMEADNNCLMIAGPSPEIGKSFVSVNIAAVLASNDKKVLLVDADLRRGHLHEFLGLGRRNGLSDFISGDIAIGDCLHETQVPGLTFIPTGLVPPNPAELLLHQRFANCLNVLSTRFDHIVIDSPPVLAVTDASIIGQMCGATLMVLKSGEHPIREIQQSVKRLQQSGVNLRGIIINDVSLQAKRYGGGKYSYQYAYSKD